MHHSQHALLLTAHKTFSHETLWRQDADDISAFVECCICFIQRKRQDWEEEEQGAMDDMSSPHAIHKTSYGKTPAKATKDSSIGTCLICNEE